MASVVVLVFMLDNLPGFNEVLNKTLQGAKFKTPAAFLPSTVGQCNAIAIQAILESLRNASDIETRQNRTDEIKLNDMSQEWSPESLYSLGSILDISIPEKAIKDILKSEERSDCVDEVKVNNVTKVPESAPFMVAIFESLSNVTAQTCAGTLMSPHWVLTAASCVNMLGNFYENVTSNSIYTVVVNATDSLTDGTAYNVTTVLLHPDYHRHKRVTSLMLPVPDDNHIALMRIEPGVEGVKDMVMDDGAGGDVRVYGWMLMKNATGNHSMHATSMPARTIPCGDERPVLCFTTNVTVDYNQLSSGGPVLTVQNNEVRVLAVAQTNERSVVGYPLYKHYKWIQNVLESQ